jgi:N-methylhydantoinase A/acetophenone carboxylase
MSVEEAAEKVRSQAAIEMNNVVKESASRMHGIEPQGCTLVAFGGAGPTHSCSLADACGIQAIIIPKLASAFSAFGLSLKDVLHVYEKNWINPVGPDDLIVGAKYLLHRALSDMRGEGFAPEYVDITILLMGEQMHINLDLPGRGKSIAQWEQLVTESISGIDVSSDVRSLIFMTSSRLTTEEMTQLPLNEADPGEAFMQIRPIYCKGKKLETPVYSRTKLVPGNEVLGPAIVEASETTYIIEDSWRLVIDPYDNAMVTKEL